MTQLARDPGSFRDPGGHVFLAGDKVYRSVLAPAAEDFRFVEQTGIVDHLVAVGRVLEAKPVDPELLAGNEDRDLVYLLEHPRLPFVSYPYEWCFSALKDAAILCLDVHLASLEAGVTLSDSSAYNVQFQGARPCFIDRLSFVPYREGMFWTGHRQFCEQFVNPLLLRRHLGVAHNAWFRGAPEGILTDDLRRLLPLSTKLRPKVFAHVVLQSAFQGGGRRPSAGEQKTIRQAKLPKATFKHMLGSLKSWIATFQPKGGRPTEWQDYADTHGYGSAEADAKRRFVQSAVERTGAGKVWDLGCNTGDYSLAAIEAGAAYVVGFDFDQGVLEAAYGRAKAGGLPFQTIFLDAANPSANQGFAGVERQGLGARADADLVLALALVHHLAIARNAPLPAVLSWIMGLAPAGVIEFVPKSDPMVQRLLALREDIFPDYTEEAFRKIIQADAHIEWEERVTESGRLLVCYRR